MTKLLVLDGASAEKNLNTVEQTDGSLSYVAVIQDPSSGENASVVGGALVTTQQSLNPTYRFAKLGFTPVANPTDFIIIQGSATMVVRLKRIAFSGVAGGSGNMPIQIVRRSSAPTLGSATETLVAAVKHDVNDANASALVYTISAANPSVLGSLVGILGTGRLFMPTVATGQPKPLEWDFSRSQDKPLILRGINDYICINANGADVPGNGVIDFEIELEESAT